jgi:uncharacterized cupredoxin-like copper-binding protein
MKLVTGTIVLALFSSTLMASGTHSNSHEISNHGVGVPSKGAPDRSVSISMQDTMKFVFAPDLGEIKDGETIEFEVRNDGQIQHEFSIGNAEEQVKHASMMQKMPNMKHNDPNTVSLSPGESATLSWKFMGKDTVVFACNIPGHFEAGMKHTLAITGKSSKDVAAN